MNARVNYRRYGLPLIAVLIFSASLLVGFGKLLHESRESKSEIKELLYWSASQIVV